MRILPLLLLALSAPVLAAPSTPEPAPVDAAVADEASTAPVPEPLPGPDSPVHDELRAIVATGVEALSTRDFARVRPLLDEDFSIVTLDNRKFDDVDAFIGAWNGLFTGEEAMFSSIEMKPVADDLTQFVDASTGFTHGVSTDTYHFTNGQTAQMSTRWSAVVRRGDDGKWRLLMLHFSVDPFDNPMMTAAISAAGRAGLMGAGAGALVGLLLGIGGLLALGFRRRA